MPTLNKLLLLGHAGQDAEVQVTSGGKTFAHWTMATNKPPYTQWHNCQAWGKTAEIAATIHKGDLVMLEGYVNYRKHKDKWYTDCVAAFVYLFGQRANKEDPGPPTELIAEGEIVEDTRTYTLDKEDIPF